jgi:hypothetical protein
MPEQESSHQIGIHNDIFKAIEERKVQMRSHRYFAIRAALIAAAIALVLFLVLVIVTFISFALQENGGFYATRFGVSGFGTFVGSFPWTAFLLLIALFLALGIFLRRQYAFAYQRSFFALLLALVAVIALASIAIPAVPVHEVIYHFAANDGIPFVPGIYQYETTPRGALYRGEVVSFGPADGSFVIENAIGVTSTVFVTAAASSEMQEIGVGRYVMVFGAPVATHTIAASGVETVQNF